jgi:hypothetical protein
MILFFQMIASLAAYLRADAKSTKIRDILFLIKGGET